MTLPPISQKPNIHKTLRIGSWIFGGFIVAVLLWAMLAPLEIAAVCPGEVTVTGSRRTVQHLEGGIIKVIYVTDGDDVLKNTPLIKLDDTTAKANLTIAKLEYCASVATQARLFAELHNQDYIEFPPNLFKEQNDSRITKIIQTQQYIFNANKAALINNKHILEQRILEIRQQISGGKKQLEALNGQIKVNNEQLTSVRALEKQKLIPKSTLLQLETAALQLQQQKAEMQSNIAEFQQKIGETELQIQSLTKSNRKDITDALGDNLPKLADSQEKLRAAQDVYNRVTIRAPVSGIVMDMKFHTIGGVIGPGQPILDIVPQNVPLIIDARVSPMDIDSVHKGLHAKIQLITFNRRSTPTVSGVVITVSPDAITDPVTHKSYYEAQISIPPNELKRLGPDKKLYPGMPVQVMIISGKQTAMEYFLEPITQSFSRAFKD